MIIWKPDRLRFSLTWYAQRFFMLPLVWLVFRVFNHVKVEGLENLREVEGESFIFAPNHTTAWDGWVGTVWALSQRKNLVNRESYTAVFAAPENVPTKLLRVLVSTLGAIPVDREQGVEQFALQDTVRLFDEGKTQMILTVYPEGTRSKNGRLRRKGKPGLGWIQYRTKAPVVPIYHVGGTRMPGFGLKMKIRIGKPLRLERWQDEPDELMTWRGITGEVMDSLRVLEHEELGRDPNAQPPRRRFREGRRSKAEERKQAKGAAMAARRELVASS